MTNTKSQSALYMSLISLFVLAISFGSSSAQVLSTPISIAVGLCTSTILGNNANTKPMAPFAGETDYRLGGSFRDAMPGFEFRATLTLDKEDNFRLPFILQFSKYQSNERLPQGRLIEDHLFHSVSLFEASTGLHYVVKNVKKGKAKIYTGLEFKGAFLSNSIYTLDRVYFEQPQSNKHVNWPSKDNAFRLGMVARVGVEGRIHEGWYINSSVGLSAMNLLFRDKKRGELLSVQGQFETIESIVMQFNFSLLMQVNI